MHSRDEPSEPAGAVLPGWDSGREEGTGSTMMSKSDTFQGPGGFRTPSAPGRAAHKPHGGSNREITQTGQEGQGRGGEKRKGTTVTQKQRKGRLDREGKITEIKARWKMKREGR